MSISLIVAMDRQGLIGINGNLPWHRPEDLKNFHRLTKENTIVMGRKTHESIGKTLPNRENIVITNTIQEFYLITHNKTSIRYCKKETFEEFYLSDYNYLKNIFIIGGMNIYREFAHMVKRMYITVINDTFPINGEAVFFPWPAFSATSWRCIEQKMLGPDYYYVYDKIERPNNGSTQKTYREYTTPRSYSYT